jgi:hypothetical protein
MTSPYLECPPLTTREREVLSTAKDGLHFSAAQYEMGNDATAVAIAQQALGNIIAILDGKKES